ncbi:MAG: hypothetical protein NTW19_08155 [Planctomycetota bacterium]|nr:hypothetical protein [Planctomycetota bacterium]
MIRIAAFQFANSYAKREPGYRFAPGIYADPCFGWMDPVGNNANRNSVRPVLEGYTHSNQPAAFDMGLPEGTYRVVVTLYAKDRRHGPFCVKADGEIVLRDLEAPAGKIVRRSFHGRAKGGRLHLEFWPHMGKDFLVNTLEVFARRRVKLIPLFKSAPSAKVPSRPELMHQASDAPRRALRHVCDWLVARCPADGYLGDVWNGGARYSYTLAMPVRALLAGYDILGDAKYRAAAVRALDAIADEQLPNGAWDCVLHGRAVKRWSPGEVEHISKHGRLPMSDIGSVVATLAIGSQYAPPAARKRYQLAVRRFCDDWASRFQLPSGGFTDGQWHGYEKKIYSCATAIQAAVHSLAWRITGQASYQRIAQRAIEFLLRDCRPDGRMLGRGPHWYFRDGKPFVLETLHFGDQWYYDEGFITTWHHAAPSPFRDKTRVALENRVHGSAGLLKAMDGNVWWPNQDIWNNAKSVGIAQTLLFVREFGATSPRLEAALVDATRLIRTPACAARLGVMVDDAERPASLHGLMTWGGMANEATGFAGMTLAEAIKPGVLYLMAR